MAYFERNGRLRSLKSKTLNTEKSAVYNIELFSKRFGPGSGGQKIFRLIELVTIISKQ